MREEESGVKWEGERYGMGAVEGGVERGRGLGPREGRGSCAQTPPSHEERGLVTSE